MGAEIAIFHVFSIPGGVNRRGGAFLSGPFGIANAPVRLDADFEGNGALVGVGARGRGVKGAEKGVPLREALGSVG